MDKLMQELNEFVREVITHQYDYTAMKKWLEEEFEPMKIKAEKIQGLLKTQESYATATIDEDGIKAVQPPDGYIDRHKVTDMIGKPRGNTQPYNLSKKGIIKNIFVGGRYWFELKSVEEYVRKTGIQHDYTKVVSPYSERDYDKHPPIKTTVNDIELDSRLEGRVALLFDYLGIKWYRPKKSIYLGILGHYRPDFYLPDYDVWVEVKPTELCEKELAKCKTLCKETRKEVLILSFPYPINISCLYFFWKNMSVTSHELTLTEYCFQRLDGYSSDKVLEAMRKANEYDWDGNGNKK